MKRTLDLFLGTFLGILVIYVIFALGTGQPDFRLWAEPARRVVSVSSFVWFLIVLVGSGES